MAWFECHEQVRDELKIKRLANRLGIKYAEAVGLCVCLWAWACAQKRTGSLNGVSESEFAYIIRYEGNEKTPLKVFQECELVDQQMRISKWRKYGVKLLESKRKRMKEARLKDEHKDNTVAPQLPPKQTFLTNHTNQPKDIKDGGKEKRAATNELLKIFIPNLIQKVSKNVGKLSAQQIKQLQSLTLPYCYEYPDKILELSAEIDRIAVVLENGSKPSFDFFVSSIRRTVNDNEHEGLKQDGKKRKTGQPEAIGSLMAGIGNA